MYWTRKDGTRIKISEMDTNHLWNSMKMMERNGKHKTNPETYSDLMLEFMSRNPLSPEEIRQRLKVFAELGD